MKRNVLTLIVGSALAAGLAIVVQTNVLRAQQDPQTQKDKDISLVGCVAKGSQPDTFVLENAKKNQDDKNEKGASYRLFAAATDVKIADQLNHEVKVTGMSTMDAADPQKTTDKDLPTFQVKTISKIADKCTAAAAR